MFWKRTEQKVDALRVQVRKLLLGVEENQQMFRDIGEALTLLRMERREKEELISQLYRQGEKNQEVLEDLRKKTDETAEQVAKVARLQYKAKQDQQSGNDNLFTELKSVADHIAKESTWEKKARTQWEQAVLGYIGLLDDIDTALHNTQDPSWEKVLLGWSSMLLSALRKLDVNEIDLLGTTFSPLVAEAVDTVPVTKGEPYEIVSVIKRGFETRNQTLRKAQVITVEEMRYDQITH